MDNIPQLGNSWRVLFQSLTIFIGLQILFEPIQVSVPSTHEYFFILAELHNSQISISSSSLQRPSTFLELTQYPLFAC